MAITRAHGPQVTSSVWPCYEYLSVGYYCSLLADILAPTGGVNQDHLDLLALVVRLFSDRGFRTRIDSAADAAGAADMFRSRIAQLTAAGKSGG